MTKTSARSAGRRLGIPGFLLAAALVVSSAVSANAAATPDNGPIQGGTSVAVGMPTYSKLWTGGTFTVAQLSDGSLWSWGLNTSGQLGDGTTTSASVAVRVTDAGWTSARSIVDVSPGSSMAVALANDGTVWAWGAGGSGQMGNGTSVTANVVPVQVTASWGAGRTITKVASNGAASFAVASDGSVWSWGSNSSGALGDGTTTARSTPVQVSNTGPGGQVVTSIAAGSGTILAVAGGGVWAWGSNTYGTIGNNTSANSSVPLQTTAAWGARTIIQTAAATLTSAALASDGTVWTWGYGSDGQLGNGTTPSVVSPQKTPVQATSTWVAPVTAVQIVAGQSNFAVRTSAGTIYSWGVNTKGQLGVNSTTRQTRPTLLNATNTAGRTWSLLAGGYGGAAVGAVSTDGAIYTWGDNTNNTLGTGSAATQSNLPVRSGWVASGADFGGTAGTFTAETPGSVTATTPAHAAGVVDVLVRTTFANAAAGPTFLTANGFTYTAVAPVITTTSIPNGQVGVAYPATTLAATGDVPLTWAVTTGSLPDGLTLNAATGVISGTPTTAAAGPHTFTVTATNAGGSNSRAFTSTIAIAAPVITTTTLANGQVGSAYSQTLEATSAGPVTWAVTTGALPAGLTLDPASGLLSGTPTTAGGPTTFTVSATNSGGTTTQSLSLSVIVAAPVITTTSLPAAVVGTPYNQTLTATGAGPITWSIVSGALPAGLTLDPTTGVISGTPTTAGPAEFRFGATNAGGTSTRGLPFDVNEAPPVITTTTLPNGQVGASYSQTLTATGAGPIRWSVTPGALPAGLALDADTGVISGTPTASGTRTFIVSATNDGGTTTQSLSITVIVAAPVITTTTLPNAQVGTAYAQTLTATGAGPLTWAVTAGALPAGLTLNPAAGTISGTPTTDGTSAFTVTATNAGGTATGSLTLVVLPTAPVITTTTVPNGQVGTAYSQTLTATGVGPITWAVTAGALPAGLTLDGATGTLSGTPTTAGAATFTATATNSGGSTSRAFTTTIAIASPVITTTTLPNGQVGTAYSQTLAATSAGPVTWAVTTGALPAGLTLDSATGALSGTPTADGAATFTVTATNAGGASTQSLTLTVLVAAPVITTTTLPDGQVGAAYSQTLAATGAGPVTWAVTAGALPAGLTLDGATGILSGTPTADGAATFTVTATNAGGTDTQSLTLTVLVAAPVITTTTLPDGQVGTAYSQTLAATGAGPVTWAITIGALPTGLSLDAATGVISGTPTVSGPAMFTVSATNAGGTSTQLLILTVAIASPVVTTTTLPDGQVGTAYSQTLAATGAGPVTWAVTAGALPAGLTLDGTTGTISGIPTADGATTFTVTATNAGGTDTQSLTLTVLVAAPVITTTTLPDGQVGTAYSQTLAATGAGTVTWAVTTGALPAGLTLDGTTGILSGTPTADGAATFTVTATNAGGTAAQTLSLTVASATAPPAPTVDPSNGQVFTGCAQPGSTVTVRDADGTSIGSAVAGADCRFTITADPGQAEGAQTLTDATADGETSVRTSLRVGLPRLTLSLVDAQPGSTQTAEGYNFQPGEIVRGVLQSDPIDLGTQVADQDGRVTFVIVLPTSFEVGVHTVTLTGERSGSVSQTFTVLAAASGDDPLAVTGGSGVGPLGWAALLLLTLGGLLFGLSRASQRRRS